MSFLYQETPSSLPELFKDALINNTFNEEDINATLKMTIENSYSYLYRLQRNMITYQMFHFQTKEKDLKTTKDDLEKSLKKLDEEIDLLNKDTETSHLEEIQALIKKKDDLVRIDFGDYFLDEHYRACMYVDFELFNNVTKAEYRKSEFFQKEIDQSMIVNHPELFAYFPVVTVDGITYFDVKFHMCNGKLKIILPFGETFVYTKKHNQNFHDTQIHFVDNLYYSGITLYGISLDYYENRVPVNGYYPEETRMPPRDVDGMYFSFIRRTDDKNTTGYYGFQEAHLVDNYMIIDYDDHMKAYMEGGSQFEFKFVFFHYMKRYKPYNGDLIQVKDGNLPLMLLEESNNKPYPMPIPEVNTLILKSTEDKRYLQDYKTSIKLSYPNIYQIQDPNAKESDTYKLFYFYHPNFVLEYTPMHEFYYRYLGKLAGDLRMEEVLNKLYFGDDLSFLPNADHITDEERFKEVFNWIMSYDELNQEFGIHDFMIRETWTKYPISYKTEKMKAFVKKDYKVLLDYARKNRTIGNIFHLYASTVDLDKRFRRSSFLETYSGQPFFKSFEILEEGNTDGLLVVENEDESFDYHTMIRIRDFSGFDEKPEIGSYVKLKDDHPMYVFMMKPLPNNKPHVLRIFIDGLYCTGFVTCIDNDSQYLYLPAEDITESSYIMMEESDQFTYVTTVSFSDLSESQTIRMISTGNKVTPYASDLYLLDEEGFEIPNKDYTITPVIYGSSYSIADEEGNNRLVHASVKTMKLELKNEAYLNQNLEVRLFKEYERYVFTLDRISFPRFTVHEVRSNRQLSHVQIWHNKRLVPENLYKLENYPQYGIYRIQMLKQFNKGDEFVIEFSPYTHTTPAIVDYLGEGGVLYLDKFLNKPAAIDYYDFYINGRKLGLPNVYRIGPSGVIFTNLLSDHHIEVIERERDDEYFGYESGKEKYYYSILDFIDESFLTKEDREQILKEIIDGQKDPRTEIVPNTNDEDYIMVENLPELEENAKIFYYEELLPRKFINPDTVQFDKSYFVFEFNPLAQMYLMNKNKGIDFVNPELIFMDPNINVESDDDNTIVMLTGENEIND